MARRYEMNTFWSVLAAGTAAGLLFGWTVELLRLDTNPILFLYLLILAVGALAVKVRHVRRPRAETAPAQQPRAVSDDTFAEGPSPLAVFVSGYLVFLIAGFVTLVTELDLVVIAVLLAGIGAHAWLARGLRQKPPA